MNISFKHLSFIGSLMMATGILFAASTSVPLQDQIDFDFYHVKAKESQNQPEAGNVNVHIKAFQKGLFGIIVHKAETPKAGLILGAHSSDRTLSQVSPDPYGIYTIDISCRGTNKFSGQETTGHSSVNVRKVRGMRSFVHIEVACPMNKEGLKLLEPQVTIK